MVNKKTKYKTNIIIKGQEFIVFQTGSKATCENATKRLKELAWKYGRKRPTIPIRKCPDGKYRAYAK